MNIKSVNKLHYLIAFLPILTSIEINAQETLPEKKDSIVLKKLETKKGNDEDRNVMLNAANNTGPREVNIGLPASVGGIVIQENGMPVVHAFWPELPTRTWRQSVSLAKPGLTKLSEMAITQGELGFAVSSETKLGSEKAAYVGNISSSSFGWIKGDVNASGKLAKNLYYTAGVYANFDPQSIDFKFTNWADRTQIYRAGLTKKFENGKGKISVLYKYSKSSTVSSNALFRYKLDGKVEEVDGFKIGRDNYVLPSGRFKYLDIKSGEYKWMDASGKDNESFAHTVDIIGDYKLKNDWNLNYLVRGRYSESVSFNIFATGMTPANAESGFTVKETGEVYTGTANSMILSYSPRVPLKTLMARAEIKKKTEKHQWRFGLTESLYSVDNFTNNRSFYYQAAEADPRQLIRQGAATGNTDADGFYNYNVGGEHHNGFDNKLAVFGSDTWLISDKFSLSYGLNLRWEKLKGDHYLTPRTPGFTLADGERTNFDHDWFHIGGSISGVYKITPSFGAIADFQYTENNGLLTSYSGNVTPNLPKTKSPLMGLGLYYNHPNLSVVTQFSYLTRNNYLTRLNLVNPTNASQNQVETVYYDIETMGITADIIAKPFKGFQLHYLVTYQNPVYKNYNFNAFGNSYTYNDNIVAGISKVLMEIDPSYTYKDFKFWASFRYFSKQYANLTNVLFFAPRWETFGGINYKINDHFDIGATVVNFLNQRGVSGSISGSELITDPTPYNDRLMVGTFIRPFTVEASINFRF